MYAKESCCKMCIRDSNGAYRLGGRHQQVIRERDPRLAGTVQKAKKVFLAGERKIPITRTEAGPDVELSLIHILQDGPINIARRKQMRQ